MERFATYIFEVFRGAHSSSHTHQIFSLSTLDRLSRLLSFCTTPYREGICWSHTLSSYLGVDRGLFSIDCHARSRFARSTTPEGK